MPTLVSCKVSTYIALHSSGHRDHHHTVLFVFVSALGSRQVGHLDPQFIGLMSEVQG